VKAGQLRRLSLRGLWSCFHVWGWNCDNSALFLRSGAFI
jgi:hypothetical protein